MDPVSALGAAGSVIGIAGFGFQLSAAIYQFYSQIGDAKESLQAAVDGIDSTVVALDRIHEFLQIEEENLKKGKGLLLFSSTAILGVKDTAHKCLAIFWRIEATITNKNGPKFEKELLDRLLALKRDTENNSKQPVFKLDSSLAETASSLRNRFRWTFKGDFSKLEGYSRRLQQFQLSLTLMFSVVSLGLHQRSHQQEDWKQTVAYNYIRGIAVQGNIHSIAAQFSHIRHPDQTSVSVISFENRNSGGKERANKGLSEKSLPFVPTMAQRKRTSSLPPAVGAHLPPVKNKLQRRSREQINRGRQSSNQSHRTNSPPPVLRTATGPSIARKSQVQPPRMTGAPEEDKERNLGRSISRGRRDSESMKPDTNTTHVPGSPPPPLTKSTNPAPATGLMGERQERLGQELEGAGSNDAVQMSSQHGASKLNSITTDFDSEGSSTAVPEAQTCVYIIKQGKSHAIPHRLEPGLRDTVSSALRLRQSQKSVYKKLASLSPENMDALQAVLDDGGSGPQTRKLVQLSILQKSSFQNGSNKEPAVMAIVEDLYPQRPWRDDGQSAWESDDYLGGPPTYPRRLSLGDRHRPVRREVGPQFPVRPGHSRQSSLTSTRPHREIQDVSKDMMNRGDYQTALTTYRVWIIQQHSSLKESQSETQSWARCTVVEDVRSHDDITQRLLILDSKPPSVNVKRLSLRADQQTQIARLHEAIIDEEKSSDYQWNLRQLDLIRSKSKPLQLVPTITAIFVYLARTPRAHVGLQRLFEMEQMPEDDESQTNSSTVHGTQKFPGPPPALHFNSHIPSNGPPKFPHLANGPPPPAPPVFHPPPPPRPPDAPYNPYGPPDGYPPPQPTFNNRAPPRPPVRPPPPFYDITRRPRHQASTDDSSDSSWSSAYLSADDASKIRPKKGKTRIPGRVVSERALIDLGHPFVEEGNIIVILRALKPEQIEDILQLSADYKKAEADDLRIFSTDQRRPRRNSMDDTPRPLTLRTRTVDRRPHDRSFERVHPQNDADRPLAVTAADAAGENAPRRLPYQQRSLAHHPTLRRKPSELHLRSNAIARLGIPEAEARVALEASRVRGGLHRSVSDLNLAERRPMYPSQFDNMPYDPQRNEDDQIINQLLLDWTPQWTGPPRGGRRANIEPGPNAMSGDESVGGDEQDDFKSTSSMIEDDYYGSSEHSDSRHDIGKMHQDGAIPGTEPQTTALTGTESRTNPKHQEQVEDEARLAWGNDSTAEIQRLEEQLATLKFMRNAKRTDIGLLSKVLHEKPEHKAGDRTAVKAAQTTKPADLTTADKDDNSGPRIHPPQRRVTMDEVEDEADIKKPVENDPPAEIRDDEAEGNKPARASTFPTAMQTSEAELEWAQRVLQDSAALSEPTDPVRAETAFQGRSRRDVRAARRESSRRRDSSRWRGSDDGRRRNDGADQKVHEWRERQRSRVRSPGRGGGLEDDRLW